MFKNPSLLMRISYGKLFGLVFAGIGILLIPVFELSLSPRLQLGFVLWYIIIGAFVGLMGVMRYHPIVKIPLPWWFIGPWVGAWLNFVLMLFIYEDIQSYTAGFFAPSSPWSSPWLFILEGAIFGLLADWICTRFAGEGLACVIEDGLDPPKQ